MKKKRDSKRHLDTKKVCHPPSLSAQERAVNLHRASHRIYMKKLHAPILPQKREEEVENTFFVLSLSSPIPKIPTSHPSPYFPRSKGLEGTKKHGGGFL